MPRITSWSGWEAGRKWSHTKHQKPPSVPERQRKETEERFLGVNKLRWTSCVNINRTKDREKLPSQNKHWYHQNNVTHGRDMNQTLRQPYSNATVKEAAVRVKWRRKSPGPNVSLSNCPLPQQSLGSEVLQFHMSCKIILSGLSFITFSNTTSIWLCFHGYVIFILNLTCSSNCFPSCNYLFKCWGQGRNGTGKGVRSATILKTIYHNKIFPQIGPMTISDNRNGFRLARAIIMQLWQNKKSNFKVCHG